ncbi:MAG TPA: hypothetical protein VGL77_13700 [Armatimonadota bacterium]
MRTFWREALLRSMGGIGIGIGLGVVLLLGWHSLRATPALAGPEVVIEDEQVPESQIHRYKPITVDPKTIVVRPNGLNVCGPINIVGPMGQVCLALDGDSITMYDDHGQPRLALTLTLHEAQVQRWDDYGRAKLLYTSFFRENKVAK